MLLGLSCVADLARPIVFRSFLGESSVRHLGLAVAEVVPFVVAGAVLSKGVAWVRHLMLVCLLLRLGATRLFDDLTIVQHTALWLALCCWNLPTATRWYAQRQRRRIN